VKPELDERIPKYFDGEISEQELRSLQESLRSDKDSLDCFIENAYLHDRLRGQFQAQSAIQAIASSPRDLEHEKSINLAPASEEPRTIRFPISRRKLLTGAAIAATALLAFALWKESNTNALAGVSELQRVIAASSLQAIRAYSIDVEPMSEPSPPKRRRVEWDDRKPIKPPLDQARLVIRGKQEFVLMRKTRSGQDFITGCDGQSSWAISPDGPVRVSDDLTRFNRDVPGHEFSMPLCNLSDALLQLQAVSDIALLPVEYADEDQEILEPRRLLVATKKRGQRGPRRVEITYFAESGVIEHVRFVDMPYGPERITVLLSAMQPSTVPEDFFHHRNHHAPDREIERE
jgi:hypothetical protein